MSMPRLMACMQPKYVRRSQNYMTPKQLRMAIAGEQVELRDLAEVAEVSAAQLSRIQRGQSNASIATMRRLELFFTARGLVFSQHNGMVSVSAPEGVEDARPEVPAQINACTPKTKRPPRRAAKRTQTNE